MTHTKALVSVIITTHNRSDFLKETLLSISNQSYMNIEILVIDDGSNDLEAQKNKEICQVISQSKYYFKQNTGEPDSRNYGIKRARGNFIGFCDDDDLWVTDKLKMQLDFFKKHPKASIVTGDIEYISANGDKTGDIKSHRGKDKGYIFRELLIKNRTASIVPLLKEEVFEKVGLFNSNFTIAEDWEFWRRVSYFFDFYAINKVQAYVRLHNTNITNTRKKSPIERFLLYRKLTKALLKWGKKKFSKDEIRVVKQEEYNFYYKLLYNNFSGYSKKLSFAIEVMKHSFLDFFHLVYTLSIYRLQSNGPKK